MTNMEKQKLNLPQGWVIKKWGEVLEIRSGRNQKEVIDPKGEYPILGSAGKVMRIGIYVRKALRLSEEKVQFSRTERVAGSKANIFATLDDKQRDFIDFILIKYIESGVNELDQEELPILLTNKYQSLEDAKDVLGSVAKISSLFIEFQKFLYGQRVV